MVGLVGGKRKKRKRLGGKGGSRERKWTGHTAEHWSSGPVVHPPEPEPLLDTHTTRPDTSKRQQKQGLKEEKKWTIKKKKDYC